MNVIRVQVNGGKCEFLLNKIKYLGQVIDRHGIKSDPPRATVIEDMPTAKNVIILQAFFGLVNYYQIYILNIHNVRTELNDLLEKNTKRCWTGK